MRTRFLLLAIVALAVLATGVFYFQKQQRAKNKRTNTSQGITINQPKNMKITSPVFENNASIPMKYTCDGENINPPLEIEEVPPEAKSLALIVDDPDAPLPAGFVHWVLFNLDPATKEIKENSVPQNSIEGMNSSGRIGYTSPCPPTGTHRYFFKLYALDTMLDLNSSATREDVEMAMKGHILAKAELVGLYKRQ